MVQDCFGFQQEISGYINLSLGTTKACAHEESVPKQMVG
jgi:hypothetical protein